VNVAGGLDRPERGKDDIGPLLTETRSERVRYLPLVQVDLFTSGLYGLLHELQIIQRDSASEP